VSPYLDEWTKIARQQPPYRDREGMSDAHRKELLRSAALIGLGTAGGIAVGGATGFGVRKFLLHRAAGLSKAQRRVLYAKYRGMPRSSSLVGGALGMGTGLSYELMDKERSKRMKRVGRLPRNRR
jgi:hypothetical protein